MLKNWTTLIYFNGTCFIRVHILMYALYVFIGCASLMPKKDTFLTGNVKQTNTKLGPFSSLKVNCYIHLYNTHTH